MDRNFTFSCASGRECAGECCAGVDIFLSPYDVLRMKNGLGISSDEFLKKYTGIILGETGLPILFLEMDKDNGKNCHFLGENGCGVYDDRPSRCRTFPLKSLGMGNYGPIKDVNCPGLDEGEEWTLDAWKRDQEIDTYREMDELFTDISQDDLLLKKNMQDPKVLEMFFMVHDMEKFRRFVFESKFLSVFDIDDGEIAGMKGSEVELLKFALKWLKFGLIDKDVLKVKKSASKV